MPKAKDDLLITFVARPALRDKLAALAAQDGQSMAEVLRRMIDAEYDRRGLGEPNREPESEGENA